MMANENLGVSVCGTKLHVVDLVPLIDNLGKRLDGWIGKNSSIGGRVILIKSSLSSIFIYYMYMYLFPDTCVESMTKTIRRFFVKGLELKEISYGKVVFDQCTQV